VGGKARPHRRRMAALLPRTHMPFLPYETSDVYLASYLLCQGALLIETERVGPRRTIFRFASDEFLHSLLRAYWSNDDIVVPATRLFDSLRGLKSRIRKRPRAAPRRRAGRISRDSPKRPC
jgi:hypothetical protein